MLTNASREVTWTLRQVTGEPWQRFTFLPFSSFFFFPSLQDSGVEEGGCSATHGSWPHSINGFVQMEVDFVHYSNTQDSLRLYGLDEADVSEVPT